MALSKEQIAAEVAKKGYKLIDATGYKNMQSEITVECSQGHKFITNIASVRHPSFKCSTCEQAVFAEAPRNRVVPPKTSNTYRIIAFDQATYKVGMSVWDNGKLVYYDLFEYHDNDLIVRLNKIKHLLSDIVIPIWKPDLMVFEDIQEQHGGVMTFKILAMLLGICEVTALDNKIPFEDMAPVVWRKKIGTVSGGRAKEKAWAVQKVKELTGLTINEDTAEAILIGYAASLNHKTKTLF